MSSPINKNQPVPYRIPLGVKVALTCMGASTLSVITSAAVLILQPKNQLGQRIPCFRASLFCAAFFMVCAKISIVAQNLLEE